MSLEFLHRSPERNIDFEVSQNLAATALEDTLGITFPKGRPKKVVLNDKNFKILYKKVGFREALGKALAFTDIAERKSKGFYDRKLNTFFIDEDSAPRELDPEAWYVDLHETTHGFVAQTNPVLAANAERFSSAPIPEDANRFIRETILDEGIATWAGIETTIHTGTEAEKKRVADIRTRVLFVKGEEEDPDRIPLRVTVSSDDLQAGFNHMDEFSKAKEAKGKLNREEKKSFRYYLNQMASGNEIYSVGLYFVEGAMRQLRANGFTTAEALQTIALDVPPTIEAFTKPEEYAKKQIIRKHTPLDQQL